MALHMHILAQSCGFGRVNSRKQTTIFGNANCLADGRHQATDAHGALTFACHKIRKQNAFCMFEGARRGGEHVRIVMLNPLDLHCSYHTHHVCVNATFAMSPRPLLTRTPTALQHRCANRCVHVKHIANILNVSQSSPRVLDIEALGPPHAHCTPGRSKAKW